MNTASKTKLKSLKALTLKPFMGYEGRPYHNTWIKLLTSDLLFLNTFGAFLGIAVVFNWVSILHDCGHGHFFPRTG